MENDEEDGESEADTDENMEEEETSGETDDPAEDEAMEDCSADSEVQDSETAATAKSTCTLHTSSQFYPLQISRSIAQLTRERQSERGSS
jgi:hypothetical protein